MKEEVIPNEKSSHKAYVVFTYRDNFVGPLFKASRPDLCNDDEKAYAVVEVGHKVEEGDVYFGSALLDWLHVDCVKANDNCLEELLYATSDDDRATEIANINNDIKQNQKDGVYNCPK